MKFAKNLCVAATAVLLLIACLLLWGCRTPPDQPDQPNPPDQTEELPMDHIALLLDGVPQYVIVREDACDKGLTSVVAMLNNALTQMGGLEQPYGLVTDYEEAVAKEILVGNTNRPESAEVLSRLGEALWRMEWLNGKLVVVGADDAATARAVRHLLSDVLGYVAGTGEVRGSFGVPASLALTGEQQANVAPDPRNPENVLIYTANVWDYGAVGDGVTDDTRAIQNAIDAVAALGGGTVYVPAGHYRINGTLTVKRSVCLAGAWYHPEQNPDKIRAGTVLLATGNRGKQDATPMITIGASAGVLGLTVYYPEQSVEQPVAYPAAFLIKDNVAGDGTQHASSLQNVTVVNGWRGIAADQGNQLPFLRDVYMTVLDYGFRINGCYDCARILTMHVSPEYWAAYEGIALQAVAQATKQTAVGVILMRTDGQMMDDVVIRSCQTAISLERNPDDDGETAGYTNLSHLTITDCTVGINNEYNGLSVSMAHIAVSGEGALCVRTRGSTAHAGSLSFYDCRFENPDGAGILVEAGAEATVSVQSSSFSVHAQHYAVASEGGVIALVSNDFSGCPLTASIGEGTLAAIVSNNKYDGELVCALTDASAMIQTASVSRLSAAQDFSTTIGTAPVVAGTSTVFDVTAYGAKGDGVSDDSAAFVNAIAAAKAAGGGIVYVPAGYYNVKQGFTIPKGVELRGIHEAMHVTTGEGSVIYVTDSRGDEEGAPFILMDGGSGLRGITFWYPEQAWNDLRAYPWTVAVDGQDCVVQNVCFGNAYRAINMADADCGGHFVDGVTGCVLREGIALDGSSRAGVLMNVHFNATFYYAVWGTELSDDSGAFGSGDMALALFQNHNRQLTAYRFGETVDETVLFIFNYRARYGMDFTGGFDGQIVGSGVDGSLCGIRVTGEYDAPLKLLNFMDDIVPGETEEGNLGIYVDVDDASTVHFVASGASSYNYVPSGLVHLEAGNLILEGFVAKVTPDSGNGAIRVKNGYAELSGIIFNHVGRLGSDGAFTQQTDSSRTIDIRVDEGGEVELYSAIGRRFFRDRIDGTADEYHYIVTK